MAKNRYDHDDTMEQERGTARAPYNFVSLVEDEPLAGHVVPHDRYHRDKHTGYFDVTLETVTPLFVRGMLTAEQHQANQSKPKDEQYVTPYCFMVNGKPVIPGSSLRGMIRSLVEIITFGKMHFVSDANKIFFRAVAAKKDDPQGQAYKQILGNPNLSVHAGQNVQAGYLVYKDHTWYVQPAQEFDHNCPFALVPDKHEVVKDVAGIQHLNSKDYRLACFDVCYQMGSDNKATRVYTPRTLHEATATLVCTGNMAETQSKAETVRTKRKNFVLLKKAVQNRLLSLGDDVLGDYLDGLSPFQKGDSEQSKGYFVDPKGMLKPGYPVFYIEENGEIIHFGHNPNFRVAHTTTEQNGKKRAITPRDRVPDDLINPNFTDYADAMFGYVSERGTEKRDPVAYAGRIAVTSATLAANQEGIAVYDADHELRRTPGSPKPTTFQHYLEQPDGIHTPKPNLYHYGVKAARIRGHKLYWRQQVDIAHLQRENTDGSKDNVETEFHPVREGTTFKFRVYFENLTDAELGALSWALTLDGDKSLHHMIGMGKPYGLGVIRLSPTLVLSDRAARYGTLFNDNGTWHLPVKEAGDYVQAFKQALYAHDIDFDAADRIRQLKAMLRLYNPDPELFSYMQITPNEYKDRPVLPYPTEVESIYRTKEAERRRAKKALIGFEIGDEIAGVVFENTNGIGFMPKKQYGGKEYEGYIPADKVIKQRNIDTRVDARILEIIEGDPGTLICEQILRDRNNP